MGKLRDRMARGITITAMATGPMAASLGIASIAVAGGPAQAAQAASWHAVAWYGTKSQCVDDGQQYEREGWQYKCTYGYFVGLNQDLWWLWIYD